MGREKLNAVRRVYLDVGPLSRWERVKVRAGRENQRGRREPKEPRDLRRDWSFPFF